MTRAWQAATRFSKKAFTGCISPAVWVLRITAIQGFRPAGSADGPDRRRKSMMVAFRYDNGAVGTLYYSREIPSLLRGLRVSKLMGRGGVISFESNGAAMLVRGRRMPRLVFPGFRDIRGYQAMYRDFVGAIRTGSPPEMSLERAMDDHRLMDQIYASLDIASSMQHEHYDILIIGTGAGGATLAHALAPTGARILVLERGDYVPQEDENWSPEAVWKHLRYRAKERLLDESGTEFQPYTHYGVGGNTKYWGSVLHRLRREDFLDLEHAGGLSPAWPISYETLAPYLRSGGASLSRPRHRGLRPDRAAARSVSVRGRAACLRRCSRSSINCASLGLHPFRCHWASSGRARPAAAACATPAIRSRARFAQRATLKSVASSRR